jgi:hypothetical protein
MKPRSLDAGCDVVDGGLFRPRRSSNSDLHGYDGGCLLAGRISLVA